MKVLHIALGLVVAVAVLPSSSASANGQLRGSDLPFEDLLQRHLKAVCGDGACNKGENCNPGDGKCCEADCGCAANACSDPPVTTTTTTTTTPPVSFICPTVDGCVCESFPEPRAYCVTSADCPLITSSENRCSKSGESCFNHSDCVGNGNRCQTQTTSTQIQCVLPTCGDGTCDATAGEDCSTCPLDCGGVCNSPAGDVGDACSADADCSPGLVCDASSSVCADTCCGTWCKDANGPDFVAWGVGIDTIETTEAWVASDSVLGCSSGSGCTCTMSSFLADTYTIVTGGICDSHNVNPTCTDWVNCQEQCEAHGPIVIGGRYEAGECVCMATVNGVTKDVWDSTCSENDYTGVYPSCTA